MPKAKNNFNNPSPRRRGKAPDPSEFAPMHGPVRHICIGCRMSVVAADPKVKLCGPCQEATPNQECSTCGSKFKSPGKRDVCFGCRQELADTARAKTQMKKPPMFFD